MAIERRYWDSACFLAILNNEPGRVEICAPVLRAATLGSLQVVTSAFTITEVLYPKGGERLSPGLRETVKRFFRHPGIMLVEVDRVIAESAQEVVWENGARPKDAVHLASALYARVPVMETYDARLIALSGKLGGDPMLEIREPEPWPGGGPAAPPPSDSLFDDIGG